MNKQVLIVFFISLAVVLAACGNAYVYESPEAVVQVEPVAEVASVEPEPVLLTVFLYDSCGGCGVGLLGCGTCDVQDRLHLQILAQFGDRLHDGSITYRLLNTRLDINEATRQERSDGFGVPEEMRRILPIAFIGNEGEGVFLVGDAVMPYVQEMLDRYVAGEDVADLQSDIFELMSDYAES